MLNRLGLAPIHSRVYEALVSEPDLDVHGLAQALGLATGTVETVLQDLAEHGLVSISPNAESPFVLAPPEPAITALIRREQEALEQVRAYATELGHRYQTTRHRRDVGSIIEIVIGLPAMLSRWEHLQQQARKSVWIFDRPPYAQEAIQNPLEKERIEAGVEYRTLYDVAILDHPEHLKRAREAVAWGEHARVGADLPVKLAIVDQQTALMPLLDSQPEQETAAIIVHRSILLNSIVALYESLWNQAQPFGTDSSREMDEDTRQLIELLALGLKDEAIAIDMNVSVRTVRRHIKQLLGELGVRSRFQAGLALREKGWI